MGVLITGMHRSGTSMFGEWMSQTGLTMGDGPGFEKDWANPRGLYERQDVVDFNNHWLGVLGGSWWAPPNVPEITWRSVDATELNRARASLDLFKARYTGWYAKDPRLSLLLPLWDRLTLRTLPIVVAVRSPRDVAMSLHMRDGITLRSGLALWMAYNRSLFSHLQGRSFLVLDLVRTLEQREQAADIFLTFLDSVESKSSGNAFTIAENTDPALLRQQCDRLPGSAERLAEDLDEIYERVRQLHAIPGHDDSFEMELPDWAEEALDEASQAWNLKIRNDILEFQLKHERDRLLALHNAPSIRLLRMIRRKAD